MTPALQNGPAPIVEPVFLVGTTRSGTTLLSLMLGHHPRIAFIGELEWVWDFDLPDGAPLDPYYAWLGMHRHFLHHRMQVDRSLDFPGLARSFFEQMRAEAGADKPIVGCQVHRHYKKALAVWPRARFIHLLRDGRDVCASWLKFGWLGSAYEAGQIWRDAQAEWDAIKATVDPSRRIEVRFEELIRFPERELGRICTFLGTEYSERMLSYSENSTYEKPDPSQAGKWPRQLSRRDVRLFEASAGEALQATGYPPSENPPYRLQPWSRPLLRLEGKLRHHRARARIYGPGLWLADLLARHVGPYSLQKRVRLALNEIEIARLK